MTLQKKMLMVLLIFVLVSCTGPTATAVVSTQPPAIITFSDPVLGAMVGGILGKANGQISLQDTKGVTRMNLNNDLQSYLSEE